MTSDTSDTSGTLEDLRIRVRAFVDDEMIPAKRCWGRTTPKPGSDGRTEADWRRIMVSGHSATPGRSAAAVSASWTTSTSTRSSAGLTTGTEALGTLSFQDCLTLLEFGTAEQKQRWIPPLFNGECSPRSA